MTNPYNRTDILPYTRARSDRVNSEFEKIEAAFGEIDKRLSGADSSDLPSGPVRFSWIAEPGQTTFPATGYFPTAINLNSVEVQVGFGISQPEEGDWTVQGVSGPLVWSTPFEGGERVTLVAGRLLGGNYLARERVFALHTFRATDGSEATDSPAMRRMRDAIRTEGGGIGHLVAGMGARGDGDYTIGETTQNEDPTNEGNLTSNMTISQDPDVIIHKELGKPYVFFCNPVGNGSILNPDVQAYRYQNIKFLRPVIHDDPSLPFSEFECHIMLNSVEYVELHQPRLIGSRGDPLHLGAGDIGGGTQNRFNRYIKIIDLDVDGIDKNNRNGVSIVSGTHVEFLGQCVIKNMTRPGGALPFSATNILSGIPMPGGFDIEPNSFTSDPRVGYITGRLFVIDNGAAALAHLLFGQDGIPNKIRGIDLEVHALRCRLGLLNMFGDENQITTAPLKVRGSATDCPAPFSLIRGADLDMDAEFFNIPNAGEIGYPGNLAQKRMKLKALLDQCGGGGAIFRVFNMGNAEWDITLRNSSGALAQVASDGSVSEFRYKTKYERDPVNAPLAPPAQRFSMLKDPVTGAVGNINGSTIVDQSNEKPSYVNAEGAVIPIPDSAEWQYTEGHVSRVPVAGSWPAGSVVNFQKGLEPGAPREAITIAANDYDAVPTQFPVWAISQVVPGAAADPAGTALAITKTADMIANGGGRYTAQRGLQSLFATSSVSVASDKEFIFGAPHSGSGGVYAGASTEAAPVFKPDLVEADRLQDMTAGFWFDGELRKVHILVSGSLADPADMSLLPSLNFGDQVRLKIGPTGGFKSATFQWRRGQTGSWTDIRTVAIPDAAYRGFVIIKNASESLHINKFGE